MIAQARRVAASPESRKRLASGGEDRDAKAGKAAATPREPRAAEDRRLAASATAAAEPPAVSTPARPSSPAADAAAATPPRPRFRFSWRWLVFFARPARRQLLGRLARDAAGVAHPRPVQPVLPRPGHARATSSRSPRRARRSRARSRSRRATRARSRRRASDRDPGVRRHEGALEAARAEGASSSTRSRSRAASPWWENLLLGFGPTILFIGLLVLLMRRAGERPERARRVRPLARPPLRAVRRPGDLRRRRRDRRGEGRS